MASCSIQWATSVGTALVDALIDARAMLATYNENGMATLDSFGSKITVEFLSVTGEDRT